MKANPFPAQTLGLQAQYRKLYARLGKAIAAGRFARWAAAKQQTLLARLRRYEARLTRYGMAVASAATLLLGAAPVQAQQPTPVGGEFRVNSYTTNIQSYSSIAMDSDGDFVIAWNSLGQDGSDNGIYAQRYALVPVSGLCNGAEVSLAFTASGTPLNTGNTFTAQLSDASGSFASPTTVGTLVGTASGTVTATLPTTALTSTGYALRIVSSDLAATSTTLAVPSVINISTAAPLAAANTTRTATHECATSSIPATAWTHYVDMANNTLVLSIQKNGQGIGTVQDGTFAATASTTSTWGDGTAQQITAAPYVTNANGWYVMKCWWDVNPTTSPASDVNVRSYFTAADLADINGSVLGADLTASQLKFYKINGAANDPNPANGHTGIDAATSYSAAGYWEYNNGATASTNTWALGTVTGGSYAEYTVASFSGGGGGGAAGGVNSNPAFPVEWLTFEATPDGNAVNLDWTTASEVNNAFFAIERSTDGLGFEQIGNLAAVGNSSTPTAYAFTDAMAGTLSQAQLHYRIRQTDTDGKFAYSEVRTVRFTDTDALAAWPNPAQGTLHIATQHDATATLTDAAGRTVLQTALHAGANVIDISALPAGVYLLRTDSAAAIKVVKQ